MKDIRLIGYAFTIAIALTALAFHTPQAAAGILIDQGPPNYLGGYASTPNFPGTPQFIADNFGVVAPLDINTITFWGVYSDSIGTPVPPIADAFTLYFYGDAGGKPGAVVASEAFTATRVNTGIKDVFGGGTIMLDTYRYDATFAPVSLGGGSYWLSVVNGGGSNADYWIWATFSASGGFAVSLNSPTTGPWTNSPLGDLAFQLGFSAVPEPSSLGLTATGIGLLVATARRRLRRG